MKEIMNEKVKQKKQKQDYNRHDEDYFTLLTNPGICLFHSLT